MLKVDQKGFTLIELLCVLMLLGLVVAITTPALADMGRKRNLELAARTLAMDLRKAQQKAITIGYTQEIEMRVFSNDYRLKNNRSGERQTVKLPEGVSYSSNNFPLVSGNRLLTFNRSGAPNRGGRVGLSNARGDIVYVIVTPATGRVRISEQPPAN